MENLSGKKDTLFSNIKERISNNHLYKRFIREVEDIVEEVSYAPIVKKAKKVAVKAKVEVEDAIEDIKKDITEVAQTIKEKVTEITNTTAVKTDLKVINGIGPKLEQVLNDVGINNYAGLTKARKKDLQNILDQAGPRYRMHNPEDWKAQAKLALENKNI